MMHKMTLKQNKLQIEFETLSQDIHKSSPFNKTFKILHYLNESLILNISAVINVFIIKETNKSLSVGFF